MGVCHFLTFFLNRRGGHTPRPILMQNGSNDVGSHKNVPFGVKIATLWNPWPLTKNRQNVANFGRDLENFTSISRLTLGVSWVNTPYSSSEPNKSVIVNRQCGSGKFKYVPKFCIGVQVTWYRAWAMTICTAQALWRPISRKLWLQWSTNRKWGTGVERSHDRWRHVTYKGQGRDPIIFRAQYFKNC